MKKSAHDPCRNICAGLLLPVQLCRPAPSIGSGDRSLSVWNDPFDVSCYPIQTRIAFLACLWSISRNLSGWFAMPLLFYPHFWPVLFTGYRSRKGIIGRGRFIGDQWACLSFPLKAVLLSLLRLELWRRLWVRRQRGTSPPCSVCYLD